MIKREYIESAVFCQKMVEALHNLPGFENNNLAELVIEEVVKTLGGSLIYIPKSPEVIRNKRNAMIANDFDGTNHIELARKYQLSVPYIYEILKKQRG